MRRREFLGVLGGIAAAWPVAGRAQGDRPRRVGVMVSGAESDPEMQARVLAFKRGLEQLGWSEGRNINIDTRFADGKTNLYAPLAKELLALGPDVILAHTTPIVATLQRESGTIPIVFI